MATVDPSKAAARRKAQRANAKAMKGKSSNPISGMAKAAAKTVATRSGPKVSETAHLSTKQFSTGGKHHAPSAQGAKKNAYGSVDSNSVGRHSYQRTSAGKHAGSSPAHSEKTYMNDLKGAVRDRQGTGRVGKHRKPGA